MVVNGIEFEPLHYSCRECGTVDEIDYKFVPSNSSIQARCVCGKWIGNVKYDKRSQEEIRKEKIGEWLERKNNE